MIYTGSSEIEHYRSLYNQGLITHDEFVAEIKRITASWQQA